MRLLLVLGPLQVSGTGPEVRWYSRSLTPQGWKEEETALPLVFEGQRYHRQCHRVFLSYLQGNEWNPICSLWRLQLFSDCRRVGWPEDFQELSKLVGHLGSRGSRHELRRKSYAETRRGCLLPSHHWHRLFSVVYSSKHLRKNQVRVGHCPARAWLQVRQDILPHPEALWGGVQESKACWLPDERLHFWD